MGNYVDYDNAVELFTEVGNKRKTSESMQESLLKSTVGWTGKNRLPNNLTNQTINGVTCTKDENGIINLNGTCTGNTFRRIYIGNIPNGTYNLSDNVQNHNDCNLYINATKLDGTTAYSIADTNSNPILNADNTLYKEYDIGLYLKDGVQFSNLKVYPMLRDASITDDTYEPYHKSVEEGIEQIYADNGVLGAKNLWDLDDSFSPSESGSYTVNSGTLTISMTAIQNSGIWMSGSRVLNPRYAKFVGIRGRLSFDCKGDASFSAKIGYYPASDPTQKLYNITTNWQHYESDDIADLSVWAGSILFYNTSGASHTLQVKNIMLRLASDPDDTYVPYAMTNRELTEAVSVESLNINLSVPDKIIKMKENSGRCGNVVNIRIQLQVTAEIANNTEIFRLDGLPHPGYGIAILGDTNEGELIPLVISNSNDFFKASCRKTIPIGYYAISYTYII